MKVVVDCHRILHLGNYKLGAASLFLHQWCAIFVKELYYYCRLSFAPASGQTFIVAGLMLLLLHEFVEHRERERDGWEPAGSCFLSLTSTLFCGELLSSYTSLP